MTIIIALLLTCGENIKCNYQEQQCKFASQYVVYKHSDCSGDLKGDLVDACNLIMSPACGVKP